MCGRARCTLNQHQIARACGILPGDADPDSASSPPVTTIDMDRFRPSYNVAPGAYLPVVYERRAGGGGDGGPTEEGEGKSERVIHCMKWGLVPSFTKKSEKPDHYRMFNARSESIHEKASFRRLIPKNRCLVAVEGFYEWKKDGAKKQPYYIHFMDERPLVFAALYDRWTGPDGEVLYTFTILTTRSSSAVKWLHDRMPVILGNNASINDWLYTPDSKFKSVLGPYEGPDLVWYPVTSAMGKPSFDGPECIKEIQLKPAEKNTISKLLQKSIDSKDPSLLDVKPYAEQLLTSGDFVKLKEERATQEDEESFVQGGHAEVKKEVDLPESIKEESYAKEGTRFKCDFIKDTELCGSKRDPEQMSGIAENPTDDVRKPFLPPTKKKAKGVGDNQSSLLSYFQRN